MIEQVQPNIAYKDLTSNSNALLIDVRTIIEHKFVGVVDDNNFKNKAILLEWLTYPTMEENNQFHCEIDEILQKFDNRTNLKLYLLCKTGVRSNMAGQFLANLGYKHCYNIINGFEGDLNDRQQRGFVNGWKAQNLPWIQN